MGGRQRVEALRVAERVVLQRVQPGRVLTPVPGELQAVVQCCHEISSWIFTLDLNEHTSKIKVTQIQIFTV